MTSVSNVFPLLLPTDETFEMYEGFIALPSGLEEPLRVTKESIMCSKALLDVLTGHEDLVKQVWCLMRGLTMQKLEKCSDMRSFLIEFKEILERLHRAKQSVELPPASYYSRLVKELGNIGWEKLIGGNDTLSELKIEITDAKNREHHVSVKLNSDYPLHAPICSASLPKAVELTWSSITSSLNDVVRQYEAALQTYQQLWDQLDDLDKNTWILEPENPARDVTMRRIAVAKHCSIMIEVDAANPMGFPECRLMGADHVVAPLREALHSNVGRWNPALSLRANLEVAMGVELPSPTVTQLEEYSGECGVCYAYRLGSEIPDCVCENENCSRPYHRACLVEWLRSLPDTRTSFDTLFGECMYCSMSITVKEKV